MKFAPRGSTSLVAGGDPSVESKVFAAPNPEVEAERQRDRELLSVCHVNGKPWAELPEEAQRHIRYEMTDEGIEDRARKLAAEGRLASGRTEVVRDAMNWDAKDTADPADPDRAFAQLGDSRERFASQMHAARFNPLDRLSAQHCPPGHATHWQAEDTRQLLGDRGYEVVLDAKGQQVKCGDLFLTSKPRQEVEYDRAMERAEHADLIKQIGESTAEQNARVGVSQSRTQRGADVLPTSGAPSTFGFKAIRGDVDQLYNK